MPVCWGRAPPERVSGLLDLVGLSSRAGDKVREFSLGMKQRLGLAAALLNDPDLLILDEPTNGLDPAGMKEVREMVRELGQRGKTIFISSHLLHEVEQICSRVAIIKKGKVLAQGKVQELLAHAGALQVKVSQPEKAAALLRELPWVTGVNVAPDGLLLVNAPPERAEEISATLARNEIFVSGMQQEQQSLESFFVEVTECE